MPRPLWAWDRVWQRLGFRRRTDRPAATGRRRLRGIHRRPQFEALEPRLALTGDLEAVADTYRIAYGTALVSYDSAGGVLANDARGAAPGAEAELVSATAGGALEFHADGSFSYAPYAGFIGWDTFSYRLTDPEQPSEPTTVSILVGLDFTVEPVTASEADGALTYTITLDTPIPQALAVDWRVGGDSATWGDDFFVGTWVEGYWVEGYTDPETGAWVDGYEVPGYWHNTEAEGGTLYFAPGQLTQTVTLALVDDAHREARERFYLALDLETDAQPHWATIVDNEPVVLTVSPAPVSELNRQLTLTFALNGPADAPVSFSWRPVAVTATAGSDFAALGPQSVTIHPGAASHSVVLPNFVVDDALNEGPETLELRIENLVGAVGGYSVLAMIGDDDRPLLAVSAPVASETAGTLRFVASLSRPTNVPVSFRWSTVDGSARAAADYLAVTDRLVTLAAGQTQAFLDVPLVDNQLFEHSEQFTLHLSELVNVAYAGLPPQATIFDNEPLPFVSLGNAVVHEGAGTATLLVTLSQAADHEVQVRWLPRGGTAVRQVDGQPGDWEHPGYWVESDWVPEQYDEWGNLIGGGYWGYREWQDGGWVVFAPGETVRSLHVGLIDDPDQEIDESFFVDLAESPQVPIAVATGVVLLWDNDRPRVSLDDVALAEALGTGSLLVRVSYASELPIQVDWAAQNGTAQAGLDWTFGYWDGGYYEEGYLFYGYLDFWGNWIDETWVSAASYDPSTTLAHVRQDRWIEPYWVDINHWGQLQFEPGETQKVLTVRIVDDQLDEDDETFTVGLSNATNAYAQNDPATVTILDNDLPPQLYVGDITVSETVGLARFTVFLTNASGLPVTVQYRTEDLSAVSGVDFAGFTAPQTLSFAPGESFRVIEVPILDDALRQGTRQFRLRLSEPTGATLLDGEALATLRDDETPTVWVTSQGAALEGAPALFTVSVVGSLSQPITLQYFTAHGTAVGSATGGDYVPQALTTLTLTAAEPTRTISVQTRQDPISELVEGFRLYVSTPANAYLATPDIWAPIVDDDPLPRVTLGDVVVDEASGYVYLTVSSDRPSERGAYVTWQTRDGSAVFGVDYSHASADWAPPEYDEWGHEVAPGYWYAYGSLYLGSGGSQTIALALINDDLPEAAETFEVRLVDAGQVEILDGSATVTIETNDLPTFSTSSSAADEGYGFLSFGVYLDRPAEALVGVYWTLTSETAERGVDWEYGQWVDGVWQDEPGIHGGYLEFPYGSQGQSITVRLLDDSFAEADETLRLRLHSPPFGLVGTAEATGTILDDDPPTLTVTSSATVQESQGYVELTLALGAPSGRTIELDWEAIEVNPPSARLGSDFVNPAQRRVTFLPGQWTRTLRVDLVDDGLAEPAEQFLVRLTPVEPRAVQLASTEATVTIAGHQATNLPPSLTVPGPQVLAEDGQLAFGSASGNPLSVADPDAGGSPVAVSLAVAHGRLSLAQSSNLTFTQGDGTADAALAFRGSLAAIDTALASLTYDPDPDFTGTDVLALEVNDLGHTGLGGPRSAQASVPLQVQSVNDAPRIHALPFTPTWLQAAGTADPGTGVGEFLEFFPALVTDPDAAPLEGLAVVGADVSQGTWEFSLDDGQSWQLLADATTLPSAAQARHLAADATTRVRFVPTVAGFKGQATLDVLAWDRTNGLVSGAEAPVAPQGGTSAYSTGPAGGGLSVQIAARVVGGNAPPTVTITATADTQAAANQVTLTITGDDANPTDSLRAFVDWNDGTTADVAYTRGSELTLIRNYAVAFDYQAQPTITVYLYDDDGGLARAETSVQLVEPLQLSIRPARTVLFEGDTLTLDVDVANDGGSATIEIDWGDDEEASPATGRVGSNTYTYDDEGSGNGPPTKDITVQVTDAYGRVRSASTTVVVYNRAPTFTASLSAAAVDEGDSITLSGTISDPGTRDTFQGSVRWLDKLGSQWTWHEVPLEITGATFSINLEFPDDNPTATPYDDYELWVTIEDEDGGRSVSLAPLELRVKNVAPTLERVGSQTVGVFYEGEGPPDVTVVLQSDDPGSDSHTWIFDPQDLPAGVGTHTVTVRVRDDDGGLSNSVDVTYVVRQGPRPYDLECDPWDGCCLGASEGWYAYLNPDPNHDPNGQATGEVRFEVVKAVADDYRNLLLGTDYASPRSVLANDEVRRQEKYAVTTTTSYSWHWWDPCDGWTDPPDNPPEFPDPSELPSTQEITTYVWRDAGEATAADVQVRIVSGPVHDAAFTLAADGTFSYRSKPQTEFQALPSFDSFTYKIVKLFEGQEVGTLAMATARLHFTWIDLDFDGLQEQHEDAPYLGALVQVNSDFSKGRVDAQGVPIPDNAQAAAGTFDLAGYGRDLHRATVTWLAPTDDDGKPLSVDIYFTIPSELAVWDISTGIPKHGNPPRRQSGQLQKTGPESLVFLVEGLAPESELRLIAQLDVLTLDGALRPFDSVAVQVVSLTAAVDGNRDGTMSYDSTTDRQRTFWFNADSDTGIQEGDNWDATALDWLNPNAPGAETDALGALAPVDSADDFLNSMRDLEDLVPYYVKLDTTLLGWLQTAPADYTFTLKFRDPQGVARVFGQANPWTNPSVNRHVTDPDVALAQVTNHADYLVEPTPAGAPVDDVIRTRLLGAYNRGGQLELLVEFQELPWVTSTELIFEVDVVGPGGYQRTFATAVTFDLAPIQEFYDTFSVDPPTPELLQKVDFKSRDDAYFGKVTETRGRIDLRSSPQARDYLLLTHGWNMSTDWKRAFADTAFKRLYWQGYEGRFGAFNWPTLVDGELDVIHPSWAILGDASQGSYNVSEFVALRSGKSLNELIHRLNDAGHETHLLAHSMGNYVAAEAIRLEKDTRQLAQSTNSAPFLASYSALQGALTAGAYNDPALNGIGNDPTFPLMWDFWRNWPTGDPGAPNTNFYMKDTKPLVLHWINVYNPDDAATSGSWVYNRLVERQIGLQAAVANAGWPYIYKHGFGSPVQIDRFYASGLPQFRGLNLQTGMAGPLNEPFLTAFEVLAFATVPLAYPIGTKPLGAWFDSSVDASQWMLSVHGVTRDENQQVAYHRIDTRDLYPGHSFQFHFDAATTSGFWDMILDRTGARRR